MAIGEGSAACRPASFATFAANASLAVRPLRVMALHQTVDWAAANDAMSIKDVYLGDMLTVTARSSVIGQQIYWTNYSVTCHLRISTSVGAEAAVAVQHMKVLRFMPLYVAILSLLHSVRQPSDLLSAGLPTYVHAQLPVAGSADRISPSRRPTAGLTERSTELAIWL